MRESYKDTWHRDGERGSTVQLEDVADAPQQFQCEKYEPMLSIAWHNIQLFSTNQN